MAKSVAELDLTVDSIHRMLDELYTPEEARLWLVTPQKLLGNQSPKTLISQFRAEEVAQLLDQIVGGAYV